MGQVELGNEVPAPPSPFVGRRQELAYLQQVVRPGAVVALASAGGTDGVGKTALAQAFAARSRFPVIFSWSVPLDGDRPHAALRRWGMRCNLSVEGATALPQLVDLVRVGFGRAGRALVVLDGLGVAQLDAARAILAVVPPEVAVLITVEAESVSRDLRARTVMIEPLLDDEDDQDVEMDEDGRRISEGEQLLTACAESRVPPIWVQVYLEGVAYSPLGIRLAAARLRTARADESTGTFGPRVDARRVASLGGPAGVARGFLDTYRRLSDEPARAFRALGAVAHGPIRPERLAPLLDVDVATATALLDQLTDASLVERVGAGLRWQIHPLVRSYASTLATEHDELRLLHARRLSAVLGAAGSADAAAGSSDLLDAVDAALTSGSADDVIALATRLSEPLAGFCHEAAVALLERAVAVAEDTGHRARSLLRTRLDALRAAEAAYDADAEWIEVEPDDVEDLGELDIALAEAEADVAPASGAPIEEATTQVVDLAALRAARAGAKGVGRSAPSAPKTPSEPDDVVLKRLDLVLGDPRPYAIPPDAPDAPAPAPVGKHASRKRGGDGRTQAAKAARTAVEAYRRATAIVLAADRDAAECDDVRVGRALAELVSKVATLTESVREARDAAAATLSARSAPVSKALSVRSEQAAERASQLLVEVEAATGPLHDAIVEAVAQRTSRDASGHRTRHDVLRVRQLVAESERRVRVQQEQVVEEADWSGVEARLEAARAAEAELAALEAGLDRGDPDASAETAATLAERAVASAREAVALATSTARTLRDQARLRDVVREAIEQRDRAEREAAWAVTLVEEGRRALGAHTDADADELRERLDEVEAKLVMLRAAADAGARAVGHEAQPAHEVLDRVSTAARRIALAVGDAERVRGEIDAWVAARSAVDAELELAALRSEAATRLASLESAAAITRREAARAWQAASHVDAGRLAQHGEPLEAAVRALRAQVASARAAVDATLLPPSIEEARALWEAAAEPLAAAEAVVAQVRALATDVLGHADGLQRVDVEAEVRTGLEVAGLALTVAERIEADWAELADRLVDRAAAEALVVEARLAARSLPEQLDRLHRARDPRTAAHHVVGIEDASAVIVAASEALEAQQARLRSVEVDAGARRDGALELADAARRLIDDARAAVAALDRLPGRLSAPLGLVLGEAGRELAEADALLAGAPAFDPQDRAGWDTVATDVERRAEAVARIADRVVAHADTARTLLTSESSEDDEPTAILPDVRHDVRSASDDEPTIVEVDEPTIVEVDEPTIVEVDEAMVFEALDEPTDVELLEEPTVVELLDEPTSDEPPRAFAAAAPPTWSPEALAEAREQVETILEIAMQVALLTVDTPEPDPVGADAAAALAELEQRVADAASRASALRATIGQAPVDEVTAELRVVVVQAASWGEEATRLRQLLEASAQQRVVEAPVEVATPVPRAWGFDVGAASRLRAAGRPGAALEAARIALGEAGGLVGPDPHALLWLQVAHAWLGVGRPAAARSCVDAADALAQSADVRALIARERALIARAGDVLPDTLDTALAAAKDVRRRWRRHA